MLVERFASRLGRLKAMLTITKRAQTRAFAAFASSLACFLPSGL